MGKRRSWDELREVVDKIDELGLSIKDGAREYGVKVRDIYEYNRRARKEKTVEDQGKGGQEWSSLQKSEISLPEDIQRIIVDYKRANPDHGFKRIEDHLKSKHLVVVTRKKIREVLKKHGLLAPGDSSFDRREKPCKGSRRFEARYPRELYQMDVTYIYISGISVLYLMIRLRRN